MSAGPRPAPPMAPPPFDDRSARRLNPRHASILPHRTRATRTAHDDYLLDLSSRARGTGAPQGRVASEYRLMAYSQLRALRNTDVKKNVRTGFLREDVR
eukprot:5086388-Prymnesium_polylepis.1